MKITPTQGTGVPAQSTGPQVNASKIARAKAIAAGQTDQSMDNSSGDHQADRAIQDVRKIKMKTNLSTDRDGQITEQIPQETQVEDQNPISDTVEQVVEETKPLSPQFAALAKAKRAVQIERANFEKEKAAWEAQKSQNTGDFIPKADLTSNPLRVLQEAGVTYDQLTEAILSNQSGNSPELASLKSELKALKEELTSQFSERDNLAEQQVLSQMKREVEALTSQGEEYEAIREARAQNLVVDLIHRTWKQTGEIMSEAEAADLVENQLIDEALPFARIKKLQSRLTPAQEAIQEAQELPPKPNTKTMRTLTNRDSARPISDRRARAIAAFVGNLKKG